MATTSQARSPAQLAREIFEALFDRRDIDAVRPLWNEDSVNHFLALGVDPRGPDELAAFFREMHGAFPDFAMTIESIFGDDRHAVVQWTATGTFDGAPFQGIAPTGRRITWRGCDVFRFNEDGTLDANTIYHDGAEVARQLGMLPPRGSLADRALLHAFNAWTGLRRRLKSR